MLAKSWMSGDLDPRFCAVDQIDLVMSNFNLISGRKKRPASLHAPCIHWTPAVAFHFRHYQFQHEPAAPCCTILHSCEFMRLVQRDPGICLVHAWPPSLFPWQWLLVCNDWGEMIKIYPSLGTCNHRYVCTWYGCSQVTCCVAGWTARNRSPKGYLSWSTRSCACCGKSHVFASGNRW